MKQRTRALACAGCLVVTAGCLQDFSPDPLKSELAGKDAGRADAGDASRSDASTEPPDASEPDVPDSEPPQEGAQDAGSDAVVIPESPPPAGCSLAGPYMMVEKFRTDALGAKQDNWNWWYVELAQSGSDLTFAVSTFCGNAGVSLPPIPVSLNDMATWPAYLTKPMYAGRKGTVQATAEGCALSFPEDSFVRGATPDYYRSTSVPLPTVDEPAQGAMPGWEDWEPDGHPGITLSLSGAVGGDLYAAIRFTTTYTGTVAKDAAMLRLAMVFTQTRQTLGYNGSPLLTGDGTNDTDPANHYVTFTRMPGAQALDPAARCQSVRDANPAEVP